MSQAQLEQAFHKFRKEYQKPSQLKVLSIINHWRNQTSCRCPAANRFPSKTLTQSPPQQQHTHQQPSQQQLDAGHSADGEVTATSSPLSPPPSIACSNSSRC
uniref:Uncharacterized protein n=1 Tax=Globodera rostochiensis TaxID=31243 RepID=A0A914IB48_GLORO